MIFQKFIVVAMSFFLPLSSGFAADVSLKKSDFTGAHLSPYSGGAYVVLADLGANGKAKMSRLKKPVGRSVEIKVADEQALLTLQAPVDEQIQFGPFSKNAAKKIVSTINQR